MTNKTSSGRKQPWVPWVKVIGHRHIQILYAKAHPDTGLEGSEESCPICARLTEGLSHITSSPSSGGVFLCSLPLCLPAALTGHQPAPPCCSHSRVNARPAGPQVKHSQAEEWAGQPRGATVRNTSYHLCSKTWFFPCLLCCGHLTTLEGVMTGFSRQAEFSRQLSNQAGDSW